MSITRGCVLLAAFAAIALSVVHLRAEQTRCAARVLKIESDWVVLRGNLWSLQIRNARMRAPDRIHDRATYLAAGVVAPGLLAAESGRKLERLAVNDPTSVQKPRKPPSAKTRPQPKHVETRE